MSPVVSTHPRVGLVARRALAVAAAKMASAVTRAAGRGGGTALPGLVATRVDPGLVRNLALQLREGSIVVTGTNGKTTTSQMLATILAEAGRPPLRNRSGSNLMRGIASTLVSRAGLLGNLSTAETLGLFEVDEAAMPGVVQEVVPTTVLLLNLFRDQLDRYGEVATIGRLWKSALADLPPSTTVVANADDPLVFDVASSFSGDVTYFGIGTAVHGRDSVEHASDVKACPRCNGSIEYDQVFLGHLGHYRCRNCELARPLPQTSAFSVELDGLDGSNFRLMAAGSDVPVSIGLPGLYNVYNALAASAAASVSGVETGTIARALHHAQAAFGRMERLQVEGTTVQLALAKNPAGLNEVVRTVAAGQEPLHLLVMLNDGTADGHDVSWIWDADVEPLAGRIESMCFSGRRGADMALRFKYAGLIGGDTPRWTVEFDTEAALRQALAWTPQDERLVIIPTYTAMIEVRHVLSRLGHVRPYWEEST